MLILNEVVFCYHKFFIVLFTCVGFDRKILTRLEKGKIIILCPIRQLIRNTDITI